MTFPTQIVTLVSSGGTPVQLSDQKGAPYPTTGFGALVFAEGAHLKDAVLENTTVLVEDIRVRPGTFDNPAIQFTDTDTKTPGFFSTGAGNITLVGTDGSEITRAVLATFDWPGDLIIPRYVRAGGTIPPDDVSDKVPTTQWLSEVYAPLDSPVFVGTPVAPTPDVGSPGNAVVTKDYVAAAIAASTATVIITPDPPVAPAPSQLWWSTELGQMFIWYDDGNSAQWVVTSPAGITPIPPSFGTLVDAAVIAVDMAGHMNFGGGPSIPLALTGDRTLGNPTNSPSGQRGSLFFVADGTPRTLALEANWRPQTGVESFPIPVATNETVRIDYVVENPSVMWVTAVGRRLTA